MMVISTVNSYAITNPLDRVSVDVSITDLSGNLIRSLDIGSQVLISANVINKQDVDQQCVVIFKIIDDKDDIIQLIFIQSLLNTQENNFSLSWLVEEYVGYKIEVLVWESLDDPIPLAEKTVLNVANDINTYEQELVEQIDSNLVDYMLSLINKDRKDHGLEPVELGSNIAAQKHAEDMLKYRYLAHWDSEGYKPYMRYLQYGGEGEVRENAAFIGYMDNYEECLLGIIICEKIEPMNALKELEYSMVYDDADSNWGHRDNILDKWHNKVSIGIAYDDYFLALVQHFENDYIDWEERKVIDDFIILKGVAELPDELEFDRDTLFINSYYDPFPKPLSYEELINLPRCYTYGGGELCKSDIVEVIMPELPAGYEYVDDVNTFELSMVKNEQSNKVEFDIKFKPSIDKEGLYTFVLYVEADQYIPLTSYTVAYKDKDITDKLIRD